MNADPYSSMLADARRSVDYWQDIAQTDFAREVHLRMREKGISAAELARRLGTSKAYVSQLLGGGNFTLLTMVKVAMALDLVVRVHLEGQEERARAARDANVVDLPQRDTGSTPAGDEPAGRAALGRARSSR
ncbi:MAG TPA: helix-turn-helix transcriptional regulator [Thermoanaerobaculia bacterium]|jgi:transcriptional regulator with XRE-family HTH domain|nr:helix-turn-helix transcriptional regulator [Thermoanaerobaculia bacterium]